MALNGLLFGKKHFKETYKMKRIILVLLMLVIAASAHAQPVIPMIRPSPGSLPAEISYSNPVPVSFLGSVSGSATDPMVLPFTTYNAALSSNTATPIGSIASWSAGNYVTIRTNAKVYWAGQGSTSTASAVLGDYVDSGEQIGFTAASSTAGSWGSSYFFSTAAASVSVRVWPTMR